MQDKIPAIAPRMLAQVSRRIGARVERTSVIVPRRSMANKLDAPTRTG